MMAGSGAETTSYFFGSRPPTETASVYQFRAPESLALHTQRSLTSRTLSVGRNGHNVVINLNPLRPSNERNTVLHIVSVVLVDMLLALRHSCARLHGSSNANAVHGHTVTG